VAKVSARDFSVFGFEFQILSGGTGIPGKTRNSKLRIKN
jgi:hypothetical protein